VFLVNTAVAPDAFWDSLPVGVQQQASAKQLRLFCIDAYKVAADCGLGKRINTIMQTCFFAISGVLPREQAIDAIKAAVEKSYGRRGQRIVRINFAAIDAALDGLHEVPLGSPAASQPAADAADSDDSFVSRVTRRIMPAKAT
jgi:pyruvate-ferredoxin/flavodoxin oxidoreductase